MAKLFVLPVVSFLLLLFWTYYMVAGPMRPLGPLLVPLAVGITVVFGALFLVWPLIGWHRFVLRDEPVKLMTHVGKGKIAHYLLCTLYLTAISFVLLMLLFLVTKFLVASFWREIDEAEPLSGIILGIATIPAYWFFYRLSPILPSVAVGRRISMNAAFRATSSGAMALLWIAIFDAGAVFALEQLKIVFADKSSYAMVGVDLFLALLHLSLITTIYGYFVEDRAL